MAISPENSNDVYHTIAHQATFEMKERGSRFIATAMPVDSRARAEAHIQDIQTTYYDATHNCFAYRTGMASQEVSRFNDDGEPSGTAGKPILQAILGRELTNVLIVVTRYFGGTKLGTGGLIRAYGGAAVRVLEQADIRHYYLTQTLHVECPYAAQPVIAMALDAFKATIVNSEFTDRVQYRIAVRQRQVSAFVDYVKNQSSGQITPEIIDTDR